MKKILVIEYSQTGQLAAVLDAILAPLREQCDDVEVHREMLRPKPAYPFPWPFWRFLDTFPECVLEVPPLLEPLQVPQDAAFDLVILGYPVWFLSPAAPLTAFLLDEAAPRLLSGRPVITVTACRNMWLMAQERVKDHLNRLGAVHCDHIALVDQGNAFATFITTPRWMWTGRKDRFLGLPPAGVAAEAVRACRRFGLALSVALARGEERSGQPLLRGLAACTVDARLIASERIGRRSFTLWARLLRCLGPPGTATRRAVLALYLVFLLLMICTVVPLSVLVKALLRPWLKAGLDNRKARYEQPSGSDDSRMSLFHEP